MSDNVFHAHLDVCKQCRNNPMSLCPVGSAALSAAVGEGAGSAPSPIPPKIHEQILQAADSTRPRLSPLQMSGLSQRDASRARQVADELFGQGFSNLLGL